MLESAGRDRGVPQTEEDFGLRNTNIMKTRRKVRK